MAGERVAALRPAIDAFGRGDHDTWRAVVEELFEPDAEWVSAWATRPHRGHEGIAHWLELMTEGFADFRAELDHIEEHGDLVLSYHRFHGIFTKSGVVTERKTGVVWEFRGDKCHRATSYFGWDEARLAAGLDIYHPTDHVETT
jgi:ketosteroid isomerase-like protein